MEHEECWLPPLSSWDARLGDPVEEFQPLCWLQSAGEAFWSLQSSSMAAFCELSLPSLSQIQSALLLFAFMLLRFLGGGSVKQMPSA